MHGMLTTELAENPDALDIDRLFRVFDYTEYGGAPLLGVNGVTIICHGGSPPRAVCNAIRVALQSVETRRGRAHRARRGEAGAARGARAAPEGR
jgi:fatty acid/phospholipid biosynthesis enzyme